MKKLFLLAAAILTIVGCGGGNGGGSGGLTHNELASKFVNALNATGVYSVSLVKSSTLQYDYVVVYDADYQEYDAIYIGGYTAGMDPISYMAKNIGIYYNLSFIPGGYSWEAYSYYDSFCGCYLTDYRSVWYDDTYRDPFTGVTFEKGNDAPKDTLQFAGLAERAVVVSRGEKVAEKYGITLERAEEVVSLAISWQKHGGKDLTDADQDSFSREALGFSITEAKAAVKAKAEGINAPVEELIEKAAAANDTTPEHVKDLIETYIGN